MKEVSRLLCCFIVLLMASVIVVIARQRPDSTTSQSPQVLALLKDALEREDAGDLTGAIEVLEKVLKIEPKDVRAMNTIAGLYGDLRKFEEEIIWAMKAIAENPQFALAYINYGSALASLGKDNEAKAAFETALRIDPKEARAVYGLGVLAEDQENFNEALGLYQKAIELNPKFEDAYISLAATYANLERFDDAIIALKKLLEIDPKASDAKAMLEELEAKKQKSK